MAQITISTISYASNQGVWDELFLNDPVQYPLGFPIDQEYSRAYSSGVSFRDLSIIALSEASPVAGLQITAHQSAGIAKLDFYGRPALLRINRNVEKPVRLSAEAALADFFCNEINRAVDSPVLNFLEIPNAGSLSTFSEHLLHEGFSAFPIYKQILDLSVADGELRQAVRTRYKTHINWGETNLLISVYDRSNVTAEIVESFRRLHIAVAGRETRSPASWHIQYQQIKEGQAFLITGSLGRQLVTAGLFLHSPLYCYYGVGVSIREMFDKPLSHAIIWRSICEAKRRGCHRYELGDLVDLYPDGYSEKEKNIADFKRGFGGDTQMFLKIE